MGNPDEHPIPEPDEEGPESRTADSALVCRLDYLACGRVTSCVIDYISALTQTQRVIVLVVSHNQERLERLKSAIQSAGFRTISARNLDAAWTRTDFFDFGAVVIDYDLKNDMAASAFRERFITLNVTEDAAPERIGMELASLFHHASELVQ